MLGQFCSTNPKGAGVSWGDLPPPCLPWGGVLNPSMHASHCGSAQLLRQHLHGGAGPRSPGWAGGSAGGRLGAGSPG